MSTDMIIHVESGIVGAPERRGQPFVHLEWGGMTPHSSMETQRKGAG